MSPIDTPSDGAAPVEAEPVETLVGGQVGLCTQIILPERGVFLVLPARPLVEEASVQVGYLAVWRDAVSDQVFIYARPLHDEAELGQSILNLRRDQDAPIESLTSESATLERSVAAAERDAEDVTPWQPMTRQLLWRLMGYEWSPSENEQESVGTVAVECRPDPMAMGEGIEFSCEGISASPEDALAAIVVAACGGGTPPPGNGNGGGPSCTCPSDNNPCTSDQCVNGQCQHTQLYNPCCGPGAPKGTCDDGEVCTENDRCNNGTINHCPSEPPGTCCGTMKVCASDGDICTSDACMLGVGCNHAPLSGNWCGNDGNNCTSDFCYYGECQSPEPMNYNTSNCPPDNKECTMDYCYGGACIHPPTPNMTPCSDDGNPCTKNVCSSGICGSMPKCAAGQTCSPTTGACSNPGPTCGVNTCPSGQYCCSPSTGFCCPTGWSCCADGLGCCQFGTCCSGQCCLPGQPCCDDGNLCTIDSCSGGTCYNQPMMCEDGDSCTTDSCYFGICTHNCAPNCPNAANPFYLLVNDVDVFTIDGPSAPGHALHLSIGDPSIAKFRIGQDLYASIPILAPPVTVDIQGLSAGGTLIGVHLDSPGGPTIACDYLKVGGSIALQFDQLPTYTPYREATMTAGQQFVTTDFQLDGMSDPVLGPLTVPQSTLDALDGIPAASASFRVVVRNADGQPMSDMLVVLVQVPETSAPNANLMTISPGAATTDGQGRVQGQIALTQPNGFLEATIPNWKLLVLVGRAAEEQAGNAGGYDIQGPFDRNVLPLEQRVSNGHLLMWKRTNPPGLSPRVEAAMAVNLPHISNNAFLILKDFFDNALGRVPVVLSDSTTFPGEPWRIHDVVGTFQIESDLWVPPAVRTVNLIDYPKPVPFSVGLYPNDEVSRLMAALQGSKYDTDGVQPPDDADLIVPGGQELNVGTLATEIGIGIVPLVGDGRDIVNEMWDVVTGGEFNYIVFSLSVAGLAGDLTSFLAGAGIPANVGLAMIKALAKELPKFIVKQFVQNVGGLLKAGRSMGRYILHFSDVFETAADWLSPAKIKAAISLMSAQLRVVRDSHLVRFGALDDLAVAPFAAKAMEILSDLPRRITNRAADGIVGYARHGEGGGDTFKQLIDAIPAPVRGDSIESIGEAISKTYRRGILDTLEPDAISRVNEAMTAARGELIGSSARTAVEGALGGTAIKDIREFEFLRFMSAEALTPEKIAAMKSLRQASGVIQADESLRKVISISDFDNFKSGAFQPRSRGFLTRAVDSNDLVGRPAAQVQSGLRLPGDYTTGYATLEFPATSSITSNTKVPKSEGFLTNTGQDVLIPGARPYTGNGYVANPDGRTRPEFHLGTADPLDLHQLPIGTVMRRRDAAGNLVETLTLCSDDTWKAVCP